MNLMFLANTANGNGTTASPLFWVLYIVGLVVFFWLFFIRPQKKQEKEAESLRNSVEPGDNIMTTGGFYGVVIDVVDDTVIVEFGNNKNCRIPMHKKAIAEVEKDADAEETDSKK